MCTTKSLPSAEGCQEPLEVRRLPATAKHPNSSPQGNLLHRLSEAMLPLMLDTGMNLETVHHDGDSSEHVRRQLVVGWENLQQLLHHLESLHAKLPMHSLHPLEWQPGAVLG